MAKEKKQATKLGMAVKLTSTSVPAATVQFIAHVQSCSFYNLCQV